MDECCGVQTKDERLVQGDEGTCDAAATAPAIAGDTELEGHPVQEPEGASSAHEAPQQDESVPPELRPDADGNPPKLTPELLRRLRGKYFTVKHPYLIDCGHKLDMVNEPRHRHCENCWFTWFNSHGPLVEVADQMYRTVGPKGVEALRGKHFVKMFKRFMATIYHLQQELEQKEKANVNQSGAQPTLVSEEPTASAPQTETGIPEEPTEAVS